MLWDGLGKICVTKMHNPPHPGVVTRKLCLDPLGLSVTAAAEALGFTRKSLSELLNGKSGISPEMALRLSIAFDTSAESWLMQQAQHDLWKARFKGKKLNVKKLAA
jgi:addiction module HigA family antidote